MKGSFNQNSYVAGYILSLGLTLAAYGLVVGKLVSGWTAIWIVMCLAVIQLVVQIVFFLHLGRESKPRWNLTVLLFAVMVVVILVAGSMWIMYNLNYHHRQNMTPAGTDKSIIEDEGFDQ